MAALPDLITVHQFRNMADDGRKYELHHGEVICVSFPKNKHHQMQRRLLAILQARLGSFGQASMEFPYRALPEFDFRAADVALIAQARWDAIDPEDNLRGAPDLVIEVKSPSNTKRELTELASLCLANGAIEFWVVDLEQRFVTVTRRDGTTSLFGSPENVPLTAFGAAGLAVDEIFA